MEEKKREKPTKGDIKSGFFSEMIREAERPSLLIVINLLQRQCRAANPELRLSSRMCLPQDSKKVSFK